MKTMSPSAMIFGPMIAIFSEGILLEVSVRLLGKTIPGYLLGSMLAMSWNLFHKIASFILYYGWNIVEIYSNLLKMAQKQLNIQGNIVWFPVLTLLAVYAAFGLFAGLIGIKVGKKMIKRPASPIITENDAPPKEIFQNTGSNFNYSVIWLFIDILFIISSFFLLSHTPWFIWSSSIALIAFIWASRYRKAIRKLSKPGFWLFFVVITLITAFLFTGEADGENHWMKGLMTGIQMNFRAVIIIIGFSALGTELYNPAVRNFFMRTSFKNLPLALELSVKILPSFISSIPDFKSLIKNPVSIFYQVLSGVDKRFLEIREKAFLQKIFLITGSKGEGKTTWATGLAGFLKKNGMNPAGILSEKIQTGAEISGYDISDIKTGEKQCFLRTDHLNGSKIGRFSICPEGIIFGNNILDPSNIKPGNIVIIDEVGMLELKNDGWAPAIENLLQSDNHLIIVVRDEFLDRVKARWNFSNEIVFNIRTTTFGEAGLSIIKNLK
jgi:nucleoside-triphosphatase THEP1